MWQKSYDNSPTLYLIPTPIGNLDDMTFRSVSILKMVDIIYSEDTRVTLNLLNHFDIKKKLVALHDHNEDKVKFKVLDNLKSGMNVGLVSDRGMPVISDPGFKVVNYVSSNGYNVVALPGACAFVLALVTSSLDSNPFMFYGFLNSNEGKRRKELVSLVDYEYTMIFYEAPHRMRRTLELMLEIFGDRKISISREISKKYESIYRGSISKLLSEKEEFIGEFVIVVSGNKEINAFSDINVVDSVNMYIKQGISMMDAIKKVAKDRHVPKSDVYKEYHDAINGK